MELRADDKDTPITFAKDFLHFLLEGNVKFAMNAFSPDELSDATGANTARSVIEENVEKFTGTVMTFIEKGIEPIDCAIDGGYATVRFSVRWTGLMADTLTKTTFSGVASIKLKQSPYQGWDIVQAIVPGWNA